MKSLKIENEEFRKVVKITKLPKEYVELKEDETSSTKENNFIQKIPKKSRQKQVEIGEIIKLGRYEQKEIEWQVLDVNEEDDSVLLISKYLLFKKAYNDEKKDCTWETSTIRNYLNNEFYNITFNEEEKKKIKEETVKNSDNNRYGTNGGNDTKDKMFLLSIDEVQSYFKTIMERKAASSYGKTEKYWLRSPGYSVGYAAYVGYGGGVIEEGYYLDSGNFWVRPAMWINLKIGANVMSDK